MTKTKQLHMGTALMKTGKSPVLHAYEIAAQDRQELRSAVCLQGIVNRYGADIYICYQYFTGLDNQWLTDMEQYYDAVSRIGTREEPSDFYRLFADYREYIDTLIVFDPDSAMDVIHIGDRHVQGNHIAHAVSIDRFLVDDVKEHVHQTAFPA